MCITNLNILYHKSKKYLITLLTLTLLSCSKKFNKIEWDYSTSEIITKISTNINDTTEIFLFLDATLSMKGFAKVPNSAYNSFLEEFEANAQTGWKNIELNFFKFGTKIKKITREQFRQANKTTFYEEPGICEKTNIDTVIDFITNNYKPNHIYVIVSDLFQNEADINLLILKIKNCFTKNISIGILGLKSEFNGFVYDAKVPPYYYTSKTNDPNSFRNVIILIFSNESNIINLIDKLNSPYINKNYFTLIPSKIVTNFTTNVSKPKDEKVKLSLRASKKELNIYNFNLRDKTKNIKLNIELNINTIPYIPQINYDKIIIQCFYKYLTKEKSSKDSIPYNNVYLKQISAQQNTIKTTTLIDIPEENATYSFLIYFQPSPIDGLVPPNWIYEFSSDNPNPLKDPNKTLNLDKFVINLIRSASVTFNFKIAKLYINIKKEV